MLVSKKCNLCGGIINADEDVYSITLKQIDGPKCTQLDTMLICKGCYRDILKAMRTISFNKPSDACVFPGIPER